MTELEHRNDNAAKSADRANDNDVIGRHLLNEIHSDPQKVTLTKSNLLEGGEAAEPMSLPHLYGYLAARQEVVKDESYFKAATTMVTRGIRAVAGFKNASEQFDIAMRNDDKAAMMRLYHADRKQLEMEDKVSGLASAGLKTAFLFGGGNASMVGLVGVNVSDSAKPSDSFDKQAVDAVLGVSKAIATRLVFSKIKETDWSPVNKGFVLGLSDRFIDTGLTRTNYLDSQGGLDLKAGGLKTLASVFSPEALVVDAATLGASHLLFTPLNAYMGGALFKKELVSRLVMAGTSGTAKGALGELENEKDRGKPADWKEIGKKGLERGAISALWTLPSAIPLKVPGS